MSFLRRLFKRDQKDSETDVVSRRPVGRFRVEKTLRVLSRQVLIGEVVEGLIYPGYKVKGRKASPIMGIERERRKVDFAVTGDRVAIMLEHEIPCEEGEVLEVYQS